MLPRCKVLQPPIATRRDTIRHETQAEAKVQGYHVQM